MSFFLFDVPDRNDPLTARARSRAERNVLAITTHFALGEERASLEPVAKKSLPLFTLTGSHRLRMRRSSKPIWLSAGLVATPFLQKKGSSSSAYDHKDITSVLESAIPNEVGSSESGRVGSG